MYKNFKLTEEEKKHIMEQHKMHGYKKPLNEDQTGSLKGKTFDQYEQGALEERNFKINISNTQAVLNNPLPANIITVIKDVKSGGYTIIKGGTIEGYDTYKGGGKVLFTGPHDDCDVQLDKIIGYDSLRGGYAKKKMQEQGVPTSIPYPTGSGPKPKPSKTPAVATNAAEKPAVPANKVDAKNSQYNDSTKHTQIDPTDPNFGKNIKQSDKLIGKKATLYANPEDAVMAYQAGKSNPQSPGSIIVQVNSIDYSDNNTLQIRITPDSAKTNYSTTNQVEIIVFNRVKGTFTIVGDTKVYYSESIKNILINDYFSTELASNNKAQQSNMSEEIDTDDEEMELSKLYGDEDEDLYDLDSDMKTGQFSSEFSDPDEWEDLHDFSVARNNIPKKKMVDMGRSGPKDIDYDRAQHFYNKIPGKYDPRPEPNKPTSDYYLRTYGTPDPDMESETLADKKKNAPINFPKYTDKDRRNPENMLSWEEKKKLMAQREEKRIEREKRARFPLMRGWGRRGGMNESIQLTESELVALIKKIVNEQDASEVCFKFDYVAMVAKKNGLKVIEDELTTNFKRTDYNYDNAYRNAELGLGGDEWHLKNKMKPFVITDKKGDLKLDLFETDPYVSIYFETPEAETYLSKLGETLKSKGFRIEMDNFYLKIFVDDSNYRGELLCGDYEHVFIRIRVFLHLIQLVGPNIYDKLPYLKSNG